VHDDLGLRERKKAATRRAIADAALDLAVERGPAAVTVDDIAATAGVSARTVFNYFATKEEAILGVNPDRRRELLEQLASRPAEETPLEAMRVALRGTDDAGAVAWRTRAHLAREHPQLQSAYIAGFSSLEEELTGVVAGRIGLAPGDDPYPRLVVTVALGAMRVAVDHALATGHPIADAIDEAFAAIAGGLALPPPREK
jgi:AcrR family transcriptional regulator